MWIISEYIGDNYGVINLDYVSRIYMEYETEDSKGNRLLADYKGETICLGEYETGEQLREKVRQLGYEMARTGNGISLSISENQTENRVELEPIQINIDLKSTFDKLTSENRMIFAKSLLTSMTSEELKSFIELIQSQISKAESKE